MTDTAIAEIEETRSDVTAQVFDDTALATGRIEFSVKVGGQVIELLARYTAVWLRRDGQWQFLAWQSTPLTT